jgi:type II secretory pathway component PulF
LYQQSRQTLPWLTQALIATSTFFRATGWIWLAGMVAACVRVRGRRCEGPRFVRAGMR